MKGWRKFAAVYLVPAGVFQSVVVGGAYGTGREVVEFISSHGPLGGLLAIALVTLGFSAVMGVAFEFARVFRVYDYRSFLRTLLGPGWLAYELCFIVLLVIVLAVTGAAAGRVLEETFSVPARDGTLAMLGAVMVGNFFGRRLVEMTLTAGALALSAGLIAYGVMVWRAAGPIVMARFGTGEVTDGWLTHAAQFTLYNSALVPVLLYSARDIETRAQSFGAAFIAACAGILPALILHLSVMAHYPEVLKEALPAYWVILRYGSQAFLWVYVALLFMTIVQTGVGVLQGLNERLDAWRLERSGRSFPAWGHALVAGVATGSSLLLAEVGLVDLIARGYGSLAWGFLLVFSVPLFSRGLWRIVVEGKSNNGRGASRGA